MEIKGISSSYNVVTSDLLKEPGKVTSRSEGVYTMKTVVNTECDQPSRQEKKLREHNTPGNKQPPSKSISSYKLVQNKGRAHGRRPLPDPVSDPSSIFINSKNQKSEAKGNASHKDKSFAGSSRSRVDIHGDNNSVFVNCQVIYNNVVLPRGSTKKDDSITNQQAFPTGNRSTLLNKTGSTSGYSMHDVAASGSSVAAGAQEIVPQWFTPPWADSKLSMDQRLKYFKNELTAEQAKEIGCLMFGHLKSTVDQFFNDFNQAISAKDKNEVIEELLNKLDRLNRFSTSDGKYGDCSKLIAIIKGADSSEDCHDIYDQPIDFSNHKITPALLLFIDKCLNVEQLYWRFISEFLEEGINNLGVCLLMRLSQKQHPIKSLFLGFNVDDKIKKCLGELHSFYPISKADEYFQIEGSKKDLDVYAKWPDCEYSDGLLNQLIGSCNNNDKVAQAIMMNINQQLGMYMRNKFWRDVVKMIFAPYAGQNEEIKDCYDLSCHLYNQGLTLGGFINICKIHNPYLNSLVFAASMPGRELPETFEDVAICELHKLWGKDGEDEFRMAICMFNINGNVKKAAIAIGAEFTVAPIENGMFSLIEILSLRGVTIGTLIDKLRSDANIKKEMVDNLAGELKKICESSRK